MLLLIRNFIFTNLFLLSLLCWTGRKLWVDGAQGFVLAEENTSSFKGRKIIKGLKSITN